MTQEEKEEKMKELESKRTECLVFSRVTGWLVPRSSMNPGKVAEFNDRHFYSNKIALKDIK